MGAEARRGAAGGGSEEFPGRAGRKRTQVWGVHGGCLRAPLLSVIYGRTVSCQSVWESMCFPGDRTHNLLSVRSSAVGPVIRCEPCDAVARLLCKPLPKDCTEKIREPGCGCCMTCALSFGQPCGVYSGKCGTGLSCQPQPGETKPLQALLEGRGICANATSKRLTIRPTPPVNELPEPIETQEEDRNTTGLGLQTTYSTHRPLAPMGPQLHAFFSSAKSEMLRQEQHKRTQSFKLEVVTGLITDQQNFSLESKQQPEYGPCRREIESILSSLKITDNLNPRGFRIPNCDKKGFYKRKQCRPSKGRKRGLCWAVDKYGQPLPGDAQYYNSESQ